MTASGQEIRPRSRLATGPCSRTTRDRRAGGANTAPPWGGYPRTGSGGPQVARNPVSAIVHGMDVLRIIFAIVLPPLGVFLQVGLGKHFWINVLLTLLGYVPGIIHAIYVILKVGPEHPRIHPAFH